MAADVDGDGKSEVAIGGAFGPTVLYNGLGLPITTYGGASDLPVTFTTTGAFGKLTGLVLGYAQPGSDGDSLIQALLTPGSGAGIQSLERVYTAAGGVLQPGFPAKLQGLDFLGGPIIADVTGDGSAEVIQAADSSALAAYNTVGGGQAAGFPKFFTGWSLWAPSAGDVDGNGKTDLVMLSREGYLFSWSTNGLASGNTEWWHANHDERNAGTYGVDTRPPGVIRNLSWPGHGVSATFTAPGNDWYTGTVGHYRVTFQSSGTTISRATLGRGGEHSDDRGAAGDDRLHGAGRRRREQRRTAPHGDLTGRVHSVAAACRSARVAAVSSSFVTNSTAAKSVAPDSANAARPARTSSSLPTSETSAGPPAPSVSITPR